MTPENLNEAFAAYVCTVPNSDRLAAYLSNHPHLDAAAVSAELKAVVAQADDFLYACSGGVTWSQDFVKRFRAELGNAHPWLNDECYKIIMAYAQWLCWHEGLDAPAS